MTYLSIDPGNDTGWAIHADAEHVIACGLGSVTSRAVLDVIARHGVRVAVIERPKIYNARNMKGDPNDIITLALGIGEYAGVLRHLGIRVGYVIPREWKGTTPKEVDNARVLAALTEADRVVVRVAARNIPQGLQHNVIDAIGIGKACFAKRLWP